MNKKKCLLFMLLTFIFNFLYGIDVYQIIESPNLFWSLNLYQELNDIYLLDENYTPMDYGNSEKDLERSELFMTEFKNTISQDNLLFTDCINDRIAISFGKKYRMGNNELISMGIISEEMEEDQNLFAFSTMILIERGYDPNFLNQYAKYRILPSGIEIVLGNLKTVNTRRSYKQNNDLLGTIEKGNGLIVIFKYKGRYINPEFLLDQDAIVKAVSFINMKNLYPFQYVPEIFELTPLSNRSTVYYNELINEERLVQPINNSAIKEEVLNENIIGIQIPCDIGTDVVSPVSGTIISVDYDIFYGWHLIIRSDRGIDYILGHLQDITLKEGNEVQTGDPIGSTGISGHTIGSSLYYSIRINNVIFDTKELFHSF